MARTPRARPRLQVTDTELRAGEFVALREKIQKAELLPTLSHPIVRVTLRGQSNESFVVADEDEAHRLLRALGFDPTQTTASYRALSLGMSRYRYLPLITAVDQRVHRDERHRDGVAHRRRGRPGEEARSRRRRSAPFVTRRSRHEGLDAEASRARCGGETATLRSAPVMPDKLWRLVRDPTQAAPMRAAAAVALAPTLDEGGRARIADIAKHTAEPKLRVALERAAAGAPDEELEEAMRELESG
jgi:hypothetical protein